MFYYQNQVQVCENLYGILTSNGSSWCQDYVVKTFRPMNFIPATILYADDRDPNRAYAFVVLPTPAIVPEIEPVFEYLMTVPIVNLVGTTVRQGWKTKLYLTHHTLPDDLHETVRLAMTRIENQTGFFYDGLSRRGNNTSQ